MRTFGLLGYPLSHSFSQKYFLEKFKRENIAECEFKNFSVENLEEFPSLLKQNPSLYGLSVTIPHKQNVMKLLDEIEKSAKKIEAVNCIKRWKIAGKWRTTGYNTDAAGFERSLAPLLQPHHQQALILGTGGASKAVAFVLEKMKIKFVFVSRSGLKNTLRSNLYGLNKPLATTIQYLNLQKEIIGSHTLIINTTPLGMYPNTEECPVIPYEYISPNHLLYDLTYNPEESLFLKRGKEKGAQIKNGLEMLHLQAEKAWEIWNS